MKKFVLSAMAAAAAVAFSGSALAVDLTQPTPVPDVFATELVTAGTTAVKTTTVTTDLGFGVSAGQTRFIRYDFTNSKIGAGGITAANLAIVGVPAGNIILSSGGAAGGTNVIFQVTAPAAGIALGDDVTLSLDNGLVPDAKSPIDATYRLFETAGAAVAGTPQLAGDSGTIITFASGVALTATGNTNTADVNASPPYTKFTGAATLVEIGKINLSAGSAKTPAGLPVNLTDMLGAGTAITLAGADLSAADPAATGLTLNTAGPGCVGNVNGTSRTATGVSFVLPVVAPIANGSLCFQVLPANTVAIAAQTFTADVAPGAVPNVPTPEVPEVTAGTFTRNGLVLKSSFAETTTASGMNATINLTNLGNLAAPFTVKCVLNSGSVAGKAGLTLPALTAQRFSFAGGLGCPADGTLRGVELTFETTAGSVIGSTVRQNVSTGQASFDNMIGNQ